MLFFRVFDNIQARRPLDSFLGRTPIPCPRFLTPLPATDPKKRLLSPMLATLPKRPKITRLFATHPRPPGGITLNIQRFALPVVSIAKRLHAYPLSRSAHSAFSVISALNPSFSFDLQLSNSQLSSPSDLSAFFSYSCELFCPSAKLNSFVFNPFRTLLRKHPGVGVPPSSRYGPG